MPGKRGGVETRKEKGGATIKQAAKDYRKKGRRDESIALSAQKD